MDLIERFPPTADSAGAARRAVRSCGLAREAGERVELLVSELVSNSLRHAELPAGAEIELRMRATSERIHVEVSDSGRGFSHVPRSEDSPAGSGWGLFLVEMLAHRWGIHRNGHTAVWFEIDRTNGSLLDEHRVIVLDDASAQADASARA